MSVSKVPGLFHPSSARSFIAVDHHRRIYVQHMYNRYISYAFSYSIALQRYEYLCAARAIGSRHTFMIVE